MNRPRRWLVAVVLTLSAWLAFTPAGHATASDWMDGQGTSFRGEPTEILGPFAVFRTGAGKGRRVPLRAFSPEDCLRLHAEISSRPSRVDSLAAAKGEATGQLAGNVQVVQNGELVSAALTDRPEPELLMVFSGSHNEGEGWFMAGNLSQFYRRLQRRYPGLVEGVFLGVRHDVAQHRNIAVHTGIPWLVSDMLGQATMTTINRYLPTQGASAVLVSRQGVPLVATRAGEAAGVRAFSDQVSELLWQIDPANSAGWPDRLHYLNVTRPVEFARAKADPVLVGDPLQPDELRKYGIKRIVAHLAVAADGTVVPALLAGCQGVPSELVTLLTEALATAVVAPAIDHGRAVAGTLDYHLEVSPEDPVRESEQIWLRSFSFPVLPINEWLVLRPIPVSAQEFESSLAEVNTGKVPHEAPLSAFNNDWFAADGADSVRPAAGDLQRIDEKMALTWEKVHSIDGWVDMQSGRPTDFTVGYAWAEFESPRDTEAWLGFGSDDGVKIWLNGDLVHDKWIRRPSRVDDDVVPLRLKKGPNRMLIKIQNATDAWSFIYQLRLKPAL